VKLDNYYLNLEAIKDLSERDQDIIHSYYKEMLYAYHDGRVEMSTSFMSTSFMLTLLNSGYLIDNRDERLKNILDE
jgi:hypothetical protein